MRIRTQTAPCAEADERVKDEVYRHMFRLEGGRTGADLDLALALLRAWVASDSESGKAAMRDWLRKICPICLSLIEATQATGQQRGDEFHPTSR
jgi:DNA-directed RNA polymerase specialized sigma24 family protein